MKKRISLFILALFFIASCINPNKGKEDAEKDKGHNISENYDVSNENTNDNVVLDTEEPNTTAPDNEVSSKDVVSSEDVVLKEVSSMDEMSKEVSKEELDSDLKKLIPQGYVFFEGASADINKDSKVDYILIVKGTDEDRFEENQFGNIVDRNRRGVIVALHDENGYKVIVENLSCLSSENEDGGSYFAPELRVYFNEKNILTFHYSHGKYGYWQYLFRYQNNDNIELVGFKSVTSRGPVDLWDVSCNFSTKKKRVLENIETECEPGEEVWKETWSDIEIEQLFNLQDILDFDDFRF